MRSIPSKILTNFQVFHILFQQRVTDVINKHGVGYRKLKSSVTLATDFQGKYETNIFDITDPSPFIRVCIASGVELPFEEVFLLAILTRNISSNFPL